MALGQKTRRVEVGFAPELPDTFGDSVRVGLFLLRVLEELLLHRIGVDAFRHVIMTLVAQHAHDFGRERDVQQPDDGFEVAR